MKRSQTKDAEALLSAALSRVREAGHRITKPRTMILERLIAHDKPATIETLFLDFPKATFDLVTLYRNLATLEELGLVRRTFLPSGTATFAHEPGGPVFHYVDRRTNEISMLEETDSGGLAKTLAEVVSKLEARGHRNIRYSVQFYVE